jgi:biotin synthase-like enzyme
LLQVMVFGDAGEAARIDRVLSHEAQALCLLGGANSNFMGDKLLTTPNPETDRDRQLLDKLGMRLRPAGEAEHSRQEAITAG